MSDDRRIPLDELDFNNQLTNPAWGYEAAAELQEQLGKTTAFVLAINAEGKVMIDASGDPMTFTISDNGLVVDGDGRVLHDENDVPVVINVKRSAWGLLSYYTRDLRLGNLNNDLFAYTQHHLDLAGDCLRFGYPRSFTTALTRTVTVLELSQSKGGFFRRMLNTIRQESVSGELEPKKTTLMGKKKK